MKNKLQSYQNKILDFFLSVPEGCSVRFIHGRKNIIQYAVKEGKLDFKYKGNSEWLKIGDNSL